MTSDNQRGLQEFPQFFEYVQPRPAATSASVSTIPDIFRSGIPYLATRYVQPSAIFCRAGLHHTAVHLPSSGGLSSDLRRTSVNQGKQSRLKLRAENLTIVQRQIETLQDLSHQFEEREAERVRSRSATLSAAELFINQPIPVQQRHSYLSDGGESHSSGRRHR